MVVNMDSGEETIFSSKFACPICSYSLQELEPRLFSFNNPFGACPACDGLGSQQKIDENLVVPEPHRVLRDGAVREVGTTDQVLNAPSDTYTQSLIAAACPAARVVQLREILPETVPAQAKAPLLRISGLVADEAGPVAFASVAVSGTTVCFGAAAGSGRAAVGATCMNAVRSQQGWVWVA